jgi:hypothetical protein
MSLLVLAGMEICIAVGDSDFFFFPFFCLIFLFNGFVGLFSLMGIFGLWLSIAGDSVGIGFVLLLYVWPFWWDPKNRTF